jgi:hypothetical protein
LRHEREASKGLCLSLLKQFIGVIIYWKVRDKHYTPQKDRLVAIV